MWWCNEWLGRVKKRSGRSGKWRRRPPPRSSDSLRHRWDHNATLGHSPGTVGVCFVAVVLPPSWRFFAPFPFCVGEPFFVLGAVQTRMQGVASLGEEQTTRCLGYCCLTLNGRNHRLHRTYSPRCQTLLCGLHWVWCHFVGESCQLDAFVFLAWLLLQWCTFPGVSACYVDK